MLAEEQPILMNGQTMPLGEVVLRMAYSPWFRYGFVHKYVEDYFGSVFSQFDIYENPHNVHNYYIEPYGAKKFTLTGIRNDRTEEYYKILVNKEQLVDDDPMAGYCNSAMIAMDTEMKKHTKALDDLTFKHAGNYVVENFGNLLAISYREKLKFFISEQGSQMVLDRPKITPVHPYHMTLSAQCVENLLARKAR